MADTLTPLDEPQIRSLFTGAPKDITVPRDVRSLFNARIRSFVGQHKTWLIALDVLLVGGSAIAFATGSVAAGAGLLFVLFVAWVTILLMQHGKAKNDFFSAYSRARGLALSTKTGVPTKSVPLLKKGEKRRCAQAMHGTILDAECTLANYTYTEVTTDSEGRRQENDYDFLILHVPLPPEVGARFMGVYLNPGSWSLGGLQDKISHDRAVELESTDFNKRYNLRVVDGQDDVALYELFSPTFIDALTVGPKIHWQQVGTDLVVYRKKHESEAMDLDTFVAQAAPVVQRYRDEWR